MTEQATMADYERERKKAFRYLRKGILFLAVCILIGKLAVFLNVPFHDVISEGTAIVGWVSLWRPAEMFLYDLPELKKKTQQK